MTPAALTLVLTAALAHAIWNLCAKASRDKIVFFWSTGVVGAVLFLPALWWAPAAPWSPGVVAGVALGAVVRATYFLTLGTAYARGDLSLVYPLARGIAPVLVPVGAALALGERMAAGAALGAVLVALGVYVLHLPRLSARALGLPFRRLGLGHARFALLTGLLTTTYSVVDKWNMAAGVPPALYAYLTIPLAALLLTPVALVRGGVGAEWRAGASRVALVAVLMTVGYAMVLEALRFTPVSSVAPVRETGIVFGAFLGSVGLREGETAPRLVGAAVIVVGVSLVVAGS